MSTYETATEQVEKPDNEFTDSVSARPEDEFDAELNLGWGNKTINLIVSAARGASAAAIQAFKLISLAIVFAAALVIIVLGKFRYSE